MTKTSQVFSQTTIVACWLILVLTLLSGCGSSGSDGTDSREKILRHNIRGIAFLNQQNWASGQEEFELALALTDSEPILLNNLAVALLQQSGLEEAEVHLRKAEALDDREPHILYNLGLIHKGRGEFESSAGYLRRVVEIDEGDIPALYSLGSVLARLGNPEDIADARNMFEAALNRNPTHVSSLYSLGRLLIQEGDRETGTALIEKSQEIRTREGIDVAMGTQYGEQGMYAMAAALPGPGLIAPEEGQVAFGTPVLLENGATGGSEGALRPWTVHSRDNTYTIASDFPEEALALASVDLTSAGRHELVGIVAKAREEGATLAVQSTQGARLDAVVTSHIPAAADLNFADLDHDGDLDFLYCWTGEIEAGCRIGIHDGTGHFDSSILKGFTPEAGATGPVHIRFSDIDNDRDLDIVLSMGGERLHWLSNQRDGSFTETTTVAFSGGILDFEIADLNHDLFMDLAVLSRLGTRIVWNRKAVFSGPVALDDENRTAGSLVVLDMDNDGFQDIASGDPENGSGFFRNLGGEDWQAVLTIPDMEPLSAWDQDGDGELDLFARDAEGSIHQLTNESGSDRYSITIRPEGVRDNRNGIGVKVTILSGALKQKFEISGILPVHAGLGARKQVDAVRLLWPGGVLQDELDLPVNQVAAIEQLDRKGTSCPILYAWRDGRWRFETDFLGGCAIGYQHGPGDWSIPDTDEYILIEGGLSQVDDAYQVRLNNQLEEVIWFDTAELLVIDHPAGTQLWPAESLLPGPPWAGFKLYASADVRQVRSVTDPATGADLTALLENRDHEWAGPARLLPYKGYADSYTLEIDLGVTADDPGIREQLVLLLDGWIDYSDSSSNIAASHAGATLQSPQLSFLRDGRWQPYVGVMGFPAGLMKTMTVELTGQVDLQNPRVRIRTNMRLYWDRAQVLVGGAQTPVQIKRVKPDRADLRFGGFPQEVSVDGRPPFDYDPETVSAYAPWKAHAGVYTPFGSVTGAISELDDVLVTTRGGDELELRFPSPGPVRRGMTRSFVLFADGFGKDMDPNSAAASTVGPVPYHDMPLYPFKEENAGRQSGAGRVVRLDPDGLTGAIPLEIVADVRKGAQKP